MPVSVSRKPGAGTVKSAPAKHHVQLGPRENRARERGYRMHQTAGHSFGRQHNQRNRFRGNSPGLFNNS